MSSAAGDPLAFLRAYAKAAGVLTNLGRPTKCSRNRGEYRTAGLPQPLVFVRHYYGDTTPEPFLSIFLAHELGHHVGRGDDHPLYVKWVSTLIPTADGGVTLDMDARLVWPLNAHIFAAEVRAWGEAEKLLTQTSFSRWKTFRCRRDASLAHYASGLGLLATP